MICRWRRLLYSLSVWFKDNIWSMYVVQYLDLLSLLVLSSSQWGPPAPPSQPPTPEDEEEDRGREEEEEEVSGLREERRKTAVSLYSCSGGEGGWGGPSTADSGRARKRRETREKVNPISLFILQGAIIQAAIQVNMWMSTNEAHNLKCLWWWSTRDTRKKTSIHFYLNSKPDPCLVKVVLQFCTSLTSQNHWGHFVTAVARSFQSARFAS